MSRFRPSVRSTDLFSTFIFSSTILSTAENDNIKKIKGIRSCSFGENEKDNAGWKLPDARYICHLSAGRSGLKNIFTRSQKKLEAHGPNSPKDAIKIWLIISVLNQNKLKQEKQNNKTKQNKYSRRYLRIPNSSEFIELPLTTTANRIAGKAGIFCPLLIGKK